MHGFGCCWVMFILSQGLFSFLGLPVRGLEGHSTVGGDTARTGDPNRPKGYSIAWEGMLSISTGGKKQEGAGTYNIMVFVFPSNH